MLFVFLFNEKSEEICKGKIFFIAWKEMPIITREIRLHAGLNSNQNKKNKIRKSNK